MIHDVVVIGAGPAGIFAALSLIKAGVRDIIILEKGDDIDDRVAAGKERNILSGWGGAGAFSDGKLTISTEVGGFLGEKISRDRLEALLKEADRAYLEFGAPDQLFGIPDTRTAAIKQEAKRHNLVFVEMAVRHMGTENCPIILKKQREEIARSADIRCCTRAGEIITSNGRAVGVLTSKGERIEARYVIAAPGRNGAKWMHAESARLGLHSVPSPVDIGVRVEVPAVVLEKLTDAAYETKLIYYTPTFDDKVRTFCMNPYGEVVMERADDLMTVNGHSWEKRRTDNTNFAILVSTTFTEPFDDPLGYGHYIGRLANLLGKGVIVQRLGDLLDGRRTTEKRLARSIVAPTLESATPGDLSFVLPYRHLKDIVEMLEALDKIAPGLCSPHTLLYGVEVKFYSHRLKLSDILESEIHNLFIIGDGAGITRGLIQASVSGIIAGREIAKRLLQTEDRL